MSTFNTPLWNGGGGAAAIPRPISSATLTYDAYRALGVLRAGQTASPEMLLDGHEALNDMVDSWNTERLIIWALRRDIYELTAGASTYTLGDLEESGIRPKIEAIGILATGQTTEYGLELLTLDQFRAGSSGFISDNAYPHAAVNFPAAAAGDQIVIYSWQRLSGFDAQDTLYSFPPGYAAALKWCLALELAPSARIYAKIPDVLYDSISRNATQAKGTIKRLNAPVMLMRVDNALRCGCGYWDITTGEYR